MDFFGVSKAAAMLGWARGPGKRSEHRSGQKAICPHAMSSFWKVVALRVTESIRIQSGRRALRCFQKELQHYFHFKPEVVSLPLPGESFKAETSWNEFRKSIVPLREHGIHQLEVPFHRKENEDRGD